MTGVQTCALPIYSTTMSLRLMIVLLILHPPLRILSLTSKIPGSDSLCRSRFPPDCGTGNQPAENRRRSIKPCRPRPAFYTAPRKRLVSNRNGRSPFVLGGITAGRFALVPGPMPRAGEERGRSRSWQRRLAFLPDFPACTDAKVPPFFKRRYTAIITIS